MFVYNFEMLELMVSLSDTYRTYEKDLFLLAVTYEDLGFDLRPSPASPESRILIIASRRSPCPLSLPPLVQRVHLEISGCAAVIAAARHAAFRAPRSLRRIAAGLAAVHSMADGLRNVKAHIGACRHRLMPCVSQAASPLEPFHPRLCVIERHRRFHFALNGTARVTRIVLHCVRKV